MKAKTRIQEIGKVLGLTLILFLLTTYVTRVEELAVDGENRYGFPFRFYIEYPYTCSDCENYLNIQKIIFNSIIMGIISCIIVKLINNRSSS